MATNDRSVWDSLEGRSTTAFLVAGVLFGIDAVLIGFTIISGQEQVMVLGQAFIAAGWTAGFVGLLGLYPTLADRSPRLARVGAVLVGIGLVVFTVMGIASLAFFSGAVGGGLESLVPLFLPGVILGSVLGFLTFGATILRTESYSRRVGILVVILGFFPVVNIATGAAGIQSMTATLAIVVGLTLVNLTLGSVLRTAEVTTERTDAERGTEQTA